MNAYQNWGRWVVACASQDCFGVLAVTPGASLTVCDCRDTQLCGHGPICATPVTVEWPEDTSGIDEVLGMRPLRNRNWWPHETIEDLLRENVEHEVGV